MFPAKVDVPVPPTAKSPVAVKSPTTVDDAWETKPDWSVAKFATLNVLVATIAEVVKVEPSKVSDELWRSADAPEFVNGMAFAVNEDGVSVRPR